MIRIKKDGQESAMAVGGGFLQVANDQVRILADTAERADEVDEARAEASRQRAQKALEEALARGEHARAEAARVALRRSLVRIQIAQRRPRRPTTSMSGPASGV